MAKNGFNVFDSDMHIMEPPDLWERYIDKQFIDQAPRGRTSANVRDLGMIFPKLPNDLDERWNALRTILAELLADPEMIAASKRWPDCVPAHGRAENLLFYVDPDYGFAINGLTKGTSRQGEQPHHSRPCAHLYAVRRDRRTRENRALRASRRSF
jgi:hypothetical protein